MRLKPLFLFTLVSTCAFAAAADKEVEDLLSKMRKAYSAVSGATMEVAVRVNSQSGWQSGVLNVDYARPFQVRFRGAVGENRVERYSNGKRVVTIRNGSRSSSDTVDVDTVGGGVGGNLEWLCFFDWKRQLSTAAGANMNQSKLKLGNEEWNGKKWTVLDEVAENVGVSVRYFIDPKTYFIWRCDVTSLQIDQLVQKTEVKVLRLGVKHNSKTFEAPAG